MDITLMRKQRNVLAAALLLASGFFGFRSVLESATGENSLFPSILVGIVAAMFCLTEARVQRRPLPALAGWLVLFTWPVAVPALLLWLHGKRGALRVVLFLVAVAAVCFAGGILAGVLQGAFSR